MPTYNSEKFLQNALDSVRKQIFCNYELIVVDGGSTDRTIEIINANNDLIDKFISGPDRGQSDALDKGFAAATGNYFLWLNSDDLIAPNLLDLANNEICKNITHWLNFGTVIIDEFEKIQEFFSVPRWQYTINRYYRPQVSAPSCIFSASMYRETHGFDLRFRYTMDVDLWRTFIELGYQWHPLKIYGMAFRRHDGSKTNSSKVYETELNRLEANLMATKHDFDAKSLKYRAAAKLFRLLDCFYTDSINNFQWSERCFYDFLDSKRI